MKMSAPSSRTRRLAPLLFAVLLNVLSLCGPPSAAAAMMDLPAIDAGFVTEMGGSAKGDGTVVAPAALNYSVGREVHYLDGALGSPLGPMDRRNYFVFDLTGVTDPITSAVLKLWAGTLESVDPVELFEIYEITDPPGAAGLALALAGGTMASEFDSPADPLVMAAKTLYTKLADGPLFMGGLAIVSGLDDTTVEITITPGGLGYINTFLGGKLVLGGKVPTATAPDFPQQPFGYTGTDTPTPILTITTVPEPSVSALLSLGAFVGASGFLRRRRRPPTAPSSSRRP